MALIATIAAVSVVPFAVTADASCAAPWVEATPNEGAPGDRIKITGRWFSRGCHDTISCYEDVCSTHPPSTPMTDIDITLTSGDREWLLATVDADDEARIAVVVTVPTDIPAGPAKLSDTMEPFQVLAAPTPPPTPEPTPTPTVEPTIEPTIEPTEAPTPTPDVAVLGITETRNEHPVGAALIVAMGGAALILGGSALGIRRSSRAR